MKSHFLFLSNFVEFGIDVFYLDHRILVLPFLGLLHRRSSLFISWVSVKCIILRGVWLTQLNQLILAETKSDFIKLLGYVDTLVFYVPTCYQYW